MLNKMNLSKIFNKFDRFYKNINIIKVKIINKINSFSNLNLIIKETLISK